MRVCRVLVGAAHPSIPWAGKEVAPVWGEGVVCSYPRWGMPVGQPSDRAATGLSTAVASQVDPIDQEAAHPV